VAAGEMFLLCVQIYVMCLSFDGFGDGVEPQDGHTDPSSPCFKLRHRVSAQPFRPDLSSYTISLFFA
jgi:hypothetical protein